MRLVVNWDQPVDLEFRLYHSLKLFKIDNNKALLKHG